MDFDIKFTISYLYLLINAVTQAEECIKIDSCSCSTAQHKIDLHPLVIDTALNPRFQVTKDYTYNYQPCVSLQAPCATSTTAAVCQTKGKAQFNAGEQSSVQFSGDPALNTLELKYTAPPGQTPVRTSTIQLVCDSTQEGIFVFVDESPPLTGNFIFSLRTKYACISIPPVPAKAHHGLSTGSVLLILCLQEDTFSKSEYEGFNARLKFFVLLAVYFIGGILFLKFMRGAQGTEMIPNFEFWTDLPGLIKDGIMFTSRGCKTDSSYSQI